MTWHRFPADAEVEAGFAEALREAPPGKAPAPATLRVNDFLLGLLVGGGAVLVLHVALGLLRFSGPPRYALEAVAMVVVGFLLLRYWKRLSQEGRAVDARGNPLPGDAVLAAYRTFVLGESYRLFGEASAVAGPVPESLAAEVLVGRTADRFVLARWDADARRLHRGGLPLGALRGVEAAPDGGARVDLAGTPGESLTLGGVDPAALRDFLDISADATPAVAG